MKKNKMTNRPIAYTALMMFAAALMIATQGCGGGGGSAAAPTAVSRGGSGRVAATVKLTGRTSGRMAAQTATGTLDILITISGVYSETGEEFTPVTTTYTFDLSLGSAQISVAEVPIGVNHLLVAEANWDGATETVKAIIPSVTQDTMTTVTADATSTVVANAAIYYAEKQGVGLNELPAAVILQIEGIVAQMAADGVPISDMTPENIESLVSVCSSDGNCDVTVKIMDAPGGAGNEISDVTLWAGDSLNVYAAVFDASGTYIADVSAMWSVAGSIGTISPAQGASATLTASTVGAGAVMAQYSNLSDTTGNITVNIGTLTSGVISPVITPYATQGSVLQFYFNGTDTLGNTGDLTAAATWTATGPLQATGNPGEFTATDIGTGTVSASYRGFTTPYSFTIVEPPPYVTFDGGANNLRLNQSFTLMFTPVNGTAPFTWSLGGGAYPPGTTINPDIGTVTGMTPNFISRSRFFVRATDSLGRSTSNSDPYNISDATVDIVIDLSYAIQEIHNALATAEGGMSSINDLLQYLKALAADSIQNNTNNNTTCANVLYQIDSIVADASFTSPYLTNGSTLLDGSYDGSTPITFPIGGGANFISYIYNSSRTNLGIAQVGPNNYGTPCAMADSTTAASAMTQIDSAISMMSSFRNYIGAKSVFGDLLLDTNNIILEKTATGDCMPDLYSSTSASDGLLNVATNALTRIRDLVVQAGSGTMSTQDKQSVQTEIDEINGYLTVFSQMTAFNSTLLFDGTYSQTCPGGPAVTNPNISAGYLGTASIDVTTMSDPQPYLDTIDAALATINTQRTNLAGWMTDIATLLGYTP